MNKQSTAKTTEHKQTKQADASERESAPETARMRDPQRAVLAMQNAAGNRAVGQLLQQGALQTKLKVNAPGDSYEQEADRIAAQVMTTPTQHSVGNAPRRIQRFSGLSNGPMDAAPPSVDQALAGPGRLLEPALQQDMEQRFGHDFSSVRVHSGMVAEQSAQDMNANAYTVGHDIVFGAGRFAPGTNGGRRLLAHELAHVVQQDRHTSHDLTSLRIGATDSTVEREAQRAEKVFTPATISLTQSPTRVARSGSGGVTKTPAPTPTPTPAPVPAPVPAAPAVDPATAKARTDALVVLAHIKTEAQARAKTARSVSTSSKFYKRLKNFYLKDYLKKPSAAAGKKAATDKIGKTFAGPATAGDRWEEGALSFWNKQKIPDFARKVRPTLPAELSAATDLLSRPNRKHLPLIDSPHLVGGTNTGTAFDADVAGGGANISQLMHWGTGVKYSDIDKQTMREIFLAYELWHLEAWEIFGEDPINDLISEEAGRILGTQLRAGSITEKNLQPQLNTGFDEARAWVGSLLRVRQAEFDRWILAEKQEKANMWWGAQTPLDVWGSDTIFTKLKSGETIDAVKKSLLVERIINIYTLIFEVDEWEAKNGKIDNGDFIKMMQSGQLNTVFKKMAKGDPVTSMDALNPGVAP